MLQIVEPLTDDSRGIICDRTMFIVKGKELTRQIKADWKGPLAVYLIIMSMNVQQGPYYQNFLFFPNLIIGPIR